MSKLEKALIHLDEVNRIAKNNVSDGKSLRLLVITVVYLIVMLSVSVGDLTRLIWFAIYPILCAPINGLKYSSIFNKSLFVLPFILLIGAFNPLLDHRIALRIENINVTYGVVSFISLTIRGLLSVQAILIMVYAVGFNNLCYAMTKIGIPSFLTTQIMFVYRYIIVIVEEAIIMKRARISRGYGRKRFPLKVWSPLIGQLFIRSIQRAESVHKAMLSRGFNGILRSGRSLKISPSDVSAVLAWSILFIVLRFFDLSIF